MGFLCDIVAYMGRPSPYSQGLHYLKENRIAITPLWVIKPMSAAQSKYAFDIGAASLIDD